MAVLRGLPGPRGLRGALIARRAARWPALVLALIVRRDRRRPPPRPGRGRDRRPVLPAARQRRLRRRPLRARARLHAQDATGCAGIATITAKATRTCRRFNLDLDGLKVRSVTVGGAGGEWRRSGARADDRRRARSCADGADFTTVIAYAASPSTLGRRSLGTITGFMPHRRRRAGRGRAGGRRRPGSRPTTTRSTRRLTRSGSASRAGWRRSPTACSSASTPRGEPRDLALGGATSRWRPTSRRRRSGSSSCARARSMASATGTRIDPDLLKRAEAAQRRALRA